MSLLRTLISCGRLYYIYIYIYITLLLRSKRWSTHSHASQILTRPVLPFPVQILYVVLACLKKTELFRVHLILDKCREFNHSPLF